MLGRVQSVALLLMLAAVLYLPTPARAVNIDWVTVGGAGNACDPQTQGCFGAVAYNYRISKYEVTNAQYAEFLNAKAAGGPPGLYNTNMGSGFGGITRTGSPESYTYNSIVGRGDMPVNFVSFYNSLRFANWLHNGQGSGDTETGAYTLLGGTTIPSNGVTVTRNAGATIFLTSEDEWYKAAYFGGTSYFAYPGGFDVPTFCTAPGTTVNAANCSPGGPGDLTDVGSYTGSASPNGTFDQGGNVWEWNEAIISGTRRGSRGGSFVLSPNNLAAARTLFGPSPWFAGISLGFRVASLVPEPGTTLLVMAGMLGLASWRRRLH